MKFKVGDKVKTYVHGYKEQGTISDSWFDGLENRYYVLLGKSKHTWSLSEQWLRPVEQKQAL